MGIDFETKNRYEKIFINFEKYLEEINNYNTDFLGNIKIHKGYLINNNEFEEMKNKIESIYKMRKNDEQNPNHNEEINKRIGMDKLWTLSLNDAINQINSGKKIKIINSELYETICNPIVPGKENHQIKYAIDQNNNLILNPNKEADKGDGHI